MSAEVKFGVEFSSLIPLWREAFGDGDEFIDLFGREAYSPSRTAAIIKSCECISMLFWFDCEHEGERIAYLYAIATKKSERGRGWCKMLMQATHAHLAKEGYRGCLLVPASESLFGFYASLGYTEHCYIDKLEAVSTEQGAPLSEISAEQYFKYRRKMLPQHSVIQEGACMNFLKKQAKFYTGEGFLLAARREGEELFGIELLGEREAAGRILCALGHKRGVFRTPGKSKKFAAYLPLDGGASAPEYFAFAFD